VPGEPVFLLILLEGLNSFLVQLPLDLFCIFCEEFGEDDPVFFKESCLPNQAFDDLIMKVRADQVCRFLDKIFSLSLLWISGT
jgi:hypothetical protein